MNRAFFSTERAKNRIYASDYPASERMKFACAANVYARGTVHRVVRPLSSPSIEPFDWIVMQLQYRLELTPTSHANISANMSRPRIANKTPYLWIQRLKNPTLLGGTYLYSLYMGLKFGWVHFRKYGLLRSAFGAILVGDSSCRYCMWEKLLRRMYLSNIYKPTDR